MQVVDAFLGLDKSYQDAIADVTERMGAGMAEFITKEARTEKLWPALGTSPDKWCCSHIPGAHAEGLQPLLLLRRRPRRRRPVAPVCGRRCGRVVC